MYCPKCDKEVTPRDTGCRLVCPYCNEWIRGREKEVGGIDES